MRKAFKYLAVAFAILIGVFALVIGVVATTFNPNDYKATIIELVQKKKQRTLTIPGDIKLTFFPKLGADLGQVGLSEHKGTAEFVSVNSAKVSVELIPLFSKQLVVDHVKIDGINANLKRFKDGTTNFDDLLAKDKSGEQLRFEIDSVDISNSTITFDDQQERRTFSVANLNLETGKIANGVPSKVSLAGDLKGSSPALDANLKLKSGFTIDLDKKQYALKNTDMELKGRVADFSELDVKTSGDADIKLNDKRFVLNDVKLKATGKRAGQAIDFKFEAPNLAVTDARVSGGKLNGEAKLAEGGRVLTAAFSAPSFEGSPQAFKVPSLALDVTVKQADLDAKAKIAGTISGDIDQLLFTSPQLKLVLSGKKNGTAIDGTLTTPISANLKSQQITLSTITAAFNLPNPAGGALKLNANGNARIDLGKQTAAAALKGKLDDSTFDAKLGLSKFSPPAYTFDIDIDRLDADRYQAKQSATASEPASPAKPAAEKPMDLSALRTLQANGSVHVGSLKFENMKLSGLKAGVRAAGGKLDISPLSGNLYGGTVNGSLSAHSSNPPRFVVHQKLSGVNVGPLLKDATGKQPIEGRGDVSLDITADGATFPQLKKTMDGTAKIELRDGAVHGINVAQTVRTAKTKLGELRGNAPPQTGTGSTSEKTDFSELTGSFRITNGVARNDDLNVKSPLVRVGGAGDINLGEDRLDYLVKATIVSTLQGQGGPELQALKGLTIPVKLSGPFTAISYRVDFEGLATNLAKQKIEEKKGELQEKAKDKIKEQLKGLFKK